MKKQIIIWSSLVVLAAVAADPNLGDTWCVSTESVVLRKKPDPMSKAIKTLKYKDRATIKGIVKVGIEFDGDKDKFPDDLMPHWAKVDVGGEMGYLPIPSLASEWLIDNQDPNSALSEDGSMSAKRGFSESENDVALASMRGFSESEKGELVSMRGAAGSGKAAAKANPALVAKVIAAKKVVSDVEVKQFVAEGKLKAEKDREAKEIKAEEEGLFGGLMKGTRRATAGGLGFASKLAGSLAGRDKLVGAAASAGKLTSGMIYSEVGPVQEMQLGRVVAARVLPLYPVLDENHPASVYVRKVGAVLAAASNDPMPYNGYMFITVQSDEVNAFAVPGGFVFITTGMLKFLKDEDELIAILGHEMGHMELRHGMKSVGKENVLKLFSLMAEVGTSTATDGATVAAQQQLKALAESLFDKMTTAIRNGYGIDMESQADWRAIQFAASLGYDTKALYDVLERFKAAKGSYGGASYPEERGADVLKYRKGFGCDDDDPASGRDVRAARYGAACAF
ncbi:MAG: M48 family metalloprotease [Kiritimatiellae bacterium]|nr:M48 family metalloprotease [Kiritimatiellia bacterium]